MKDRAMQALDPLALEPVAETTGDPNSYGFRPERSTADAGAQCFIVLAQARMAQWVLEADIKGCYDNISHDWMIANVPTDKTMLRKWLKAGFVYRNELFPTEAGTPQGGIISPVLSNMTLDGLEARLAEKFPKAKRRGLKMNMVRYADDFIITGHSKEWLENELKPAVVEFLAERGLVLSPEKTRITHIKDGFDFLGWKIRKYDGKFLMKPSKANVKAHLDKIREVIKANKTAKQANLIRLLNPILRGWAKYHSHVVAKKTFVRNDANVWSLLWQWATRRHPNKGAKWVKESLKNSLHLRVYFLEWSRRIAGSAHNETTIAVDDGLLRQRQEDAPGAISGGDGRGRSLGTPVRPDRTTLSEGQSGWGRPPLPLERMLRIYCLQQWYNLSDPGAEEALYDSITMRRFAGVSSDADVIPDETSILNFRRLLEKHSSLGGCSPRSMPIFASAGCSWARARSSMRPSLTRLPRPRMPTRSATPRCTRRARASSGTSA